MIQNPRFEKELDLVIANAIREDVGKGDYSSMACIPENAVGKAKLILKAKGVLAGVDFAKRVFEAVDPDLKVEVFLNDGRKIEKGDIAFHVAGKSRSILKAERLVLNGMQRMSAVASKTNEFVKA
ncbi:MAG TPA: nicotinate-nucleotide diphosphorylase (carboxylating), partial [Flavobacteriaceae bacterium]|nr:nicotinate-nucleotide diphosphorylase (carboxylating) [Flavobacteriaceae bacterium]